MCPNDSFLGIILLRNPMALIYTYIYIVQNGSYNGNILAKLKQKCENLSKY